MRTSFILLGGMALAAMAAPAGAANHQVQMLSKGGAMVYSPAVVKVAPGDTVTFVPTHPTHNAESITGMLPPGAKPFKGAMNKPVTVKFDQAGVYGYKCLPHYGMGMVALIVAGEPGNVDEAKTAKHPGKAKKVFEELLAQAGQ